MAGNATGRAVSSIKAMLEPRIVAARTQGAAFGAQGDLAFLERITPSSHGSLTTPAIGLIPLSSCSHVAEADRWALLGAASSAVVSSSAGLLGIGFKLSKTRRALIHYSWTNWMAMEPSPTAEATLFTDRCLTSPAANTPGMLVSRSKGCRSRGHLWGGRSPPGVPSRMRFQISFLVSLRRS